MTSEATELPSDSPTPESDAEVSQPDVPSVEPSATSSEGEAPDLIPAPAPPVETEATVTETEVIPAVNVEGAAMPNVEGAAIPNVEGAAMPNVEGAVTPAVEGGVTLASDDEPYAFADSYISEEPEEEEDLEPAVDLDAPDPFEIQTADPLSFAALEEARNWVYYTERHRSAFAAELDAMSTSGEEGRRRGLGRWILAEYALCAEELAAHEQDDTAAYTRGRALVAAGKPAEAVAIFKRLTDVYPKEPRPRTGWLNARIEAEDPGEYEDRGPLADAIAAEVESAPEEYAGSADSHFIMGRVSEFRRDWESALDHYERGRELDDSHRVLLLRYAHLSERCGLDEIAVELYETLMRTGPSEKRILLNLGVLYEDLGRDSEAASCYDIVVKNSPTDERARLYLEDAKAAMEMFYDEDMEKKEDRLNQILRIPITDFELSVRARNCLNNMQITTLGDLVQRTEQELLSYKNFGETSLTEIKEILHSKGLRLGMPREEAVASIEAHANRTVTGDHSDVMNKPILELQLSIRARRTVEALGCLTVGEITKHSAEELLGMPNFGQTSLQELRNKLQELSIKLKGD